MKYLISGICLIISLLGMLMLLFPIKINRQGETCEGYLASKIPMQIGSISGTDKELAATEEVKRATERTLNVSDYLNREYKTADGKTFSLYMSYWLPNKEKMVLASTHTPDRCWIKNGWKSNPEKRLNGKIIKINDKNLFPAYSREYSINVNSYNTVTRKVWFWFIVDGKIYDYKTSSNYIPNPILWIKNSIIESIEGYPEMYFVRLDSDLEMESFLQDKDFQSLLEILGNLILFDPAQKK